MKRLTTEQKIALLKHQFVDLEARTWALEGLYSSNNTKGENVPKVRTDRTIRMDAILSRHLDLTIEETTLISTMEVVAYLKKTEGETFGSKAVAQAVQRITNQPVQFSWINGKPKRGYKIRLM